MKSHQTIRSDRDGEVWEFKGGSRTALFLIVGRTPRHAYRLVDLASGKWEAVNAGSLNGNPAHNILPNVDWTRVS